MELHLVFAAGSAYVAKSLILTRVTRISAVDVARPTRSKVKELKSKTKIPLVDLTVQYYSLKEEIYGVIDRVTERGKYILGPEVEAFEEESAAYLGVKYAVGAASGTEALQRGVGGEGEEGERGSEEHTGTTHPIEQAFRLGPAFRWCCP